MGLLSLIKEVFEREFLIFFFFFGNREVRRDVLEGIIRKFDLNSVFLEKFFFEDLIIYVGIF